MLQEERNELDALLLKMQRANRRNRKRKVIRADEIVPLGAADNARLWELIRKCCRLVTTWGNINSAIRTVAAKANERFEDALEECVNSMSMHVYTYSWRKYRHSEDCAYCFNTAIFGFKTWICSENGYHDGIDFMKGLAAEESYEGHKVATA
jgi:hypothetical protein